jgi:hypothetical protein
MIFANLIFHFVSAVWLYKSYRQWRSFLISGTLFVTFSVFIILANAALYMQKEFDRVAQLFGIDLGVRAAMFVSIIALFVLVKSLFSIVRQNKRTLVKLARSHAVDEFERRYKIIAPDAPLRIPRSDSGWDNKPSPDSAQSS